MFIFSACVMAGFPGCQKKSRLDVHLIEPCDQQNQSLQGVQTVALSYYLPDPETGFPKEKPEAKNSSTVEEGGSVDPLDFALEEDVFIEAKGFDQKADADSNPDFLNEDPYSIGRSVPIIKQSELLDNSFFGEPDQITVPMGRWDSFGQVTSRNEEGKSECEYLTSGEALEGRHGHTVTYIPAIHKVLIIGGAVWRPDSTATLEMPQCQQFIQEDLTPEISCLTFLQSAELYDPNTGTFEPLLELPNRRAYHTATLLSDNKRVLVIGGFSVIGEKMDILINGFVFDPDQIADSGDPYQTIQFNAQRANHTATLVPDSEMVVIIGGCTGSGCTPFGAGEDPQDEVNTDSTKRFSSPIEIFDEREGEVIFAAGLDENELGAFERALHKTTYSGQFIVVAGGVNAEGTICNAEVLENTGLTLTKIQTYTLETCPVGHSQTALPDGTVVLMGGITDAPGGIPNPDAIPVKIVQLWATNGIAQGSEMATGHVHHSAALLADGSVLIAGGRTSDNVTAERLVLQPLTGIYISSPVPRPLVESRSFMGIAVMSNKQVFVSGGYNQYGETSDRAELYFAE
jgi:hypothetical protein